MAKFATNTLKAKSAGVLFDISNDYSKGLAETFKDAFEKAGGKVVSYESYGKDDVDFSAILTKTGANNPDVLFLPDYYNKVSLIGRQAKEKGVKSTLLGVDGWDSAELEPRPSRAATSATTTAPRISAPRCRSGSRSTRLSSAPPRMPWAPCPTTRRSCWSRPSVTFEPRGRRS